MLLTFLRTERRAWLALVLLFLVSLPAVTPRIYSGDEAQYFSYLRSLWFDHDVSFENEYQYFADRGLSGGRVFRETFLASTTPTGLRENWGTIGSAVLWTPFYAIGDLTARALRATGRPVAVDGFSAPYVAAVCYGSAVYGFLALLLSASAVRRVLGATRFSAGHETAAILSVWIGTPLLFYMYIAPPFAHACSAFAVALFVWTWLRVRDRWSGPGLIALGASAALMTMVREQDAFYAAGPALDFLWSLAARPAGTPAAGDATCRVPTVTQALVNGVLGCVAFAVVFTPQALAYLALNGRIGPSHLVSRKMTWWSPHGLDVLLSPEHGFLFWTPLAVLGIVGLVLLAMAASGPDRRRAVGLLTMVAFQVYIAGCVESWSVAGAFGHRRFVGLTIVLVIGLAALMARVGVRRGRAGLGLALAVCVWWNVALMIQFGSGLMDRQRLELGRNAYQAFVGVPARVPEFAWRYLFDRSSFYKSRDGSPK